MVLGHRLLDRVAVHRCRRGVDEPLDAGRDAGLEHIERAADVHVKSGPRIFVALEQPQRRKVEHAIGPFEGRGEDVSLTDVATRLEDLDAIVGQRVREVFGAATHEVVVDDDLAHVLTCEGINGVRADEAGAADHDEFLSADVHRAPYRMPSSRAVPSAPHCMSASTIDSPGCGYRLSWGVSGSVRNRW